MHAFQLEENEVPKAAVPNAKKNEGKEKTKAEGNAAWLTVDDALLKHMLEKDFSQVLAEDALLLAGSMHPIEVLYLVRDCVWRMVEDGKEGRDEYKA